MSKEQYISLQNYVLSLDLVHTIKTPTLIIETYRTKCGRLWSILWCNVSTLQQTPQGTRQVSLLTPTKIRNHYCQTTIHRPT